MRTLAISFVLVVLCTSCSTFIDAVVTNSCQAAGTMSFSNETSPPVEDVMLGALDDELLSTEVEAGVKDLLIGSAFAGDLPFPGGWGWVRWEGSTEISLFRIAPSDVEPVPILVSRKVCPKAA